MRQKWTEARSAGTSMSLLSKSLHFYFLGNRKPSSLLKGKVTQSEFFFRIFCYFRVKYKLGWGHEINMEVRRPVRRSLGYPGGDGESRQIQSMLRRKNQHNDATVRCEG